MYSQKNTYRFFLNEFLEVKFLVKNMLFGLGLACVWVDKNKAYFQNIISKSLMYITYGLWLGLSCLWVDKNKA